MEWKRSTLVSSNWLNHFTSSSEVAPFAGSSGLNVNFTSAKDEWSLRVFKMSLSIRIRSLVDCFVLCGTLSCCKNTCSRYNPLKVASNFFSCKWVFNGQRFAANIQTKGMVKLTSTSQNYNTLHSAIKVCFSNNGWNLDFIFQNSILSLLQKKIN